MNNSTGPADVRPRHEHDRLRATPWLRLCVSVQKHWRGLVTPTMAGQFEPFDLVPANPPFTLPNRPEAWAEHFLAMFQHPYLLGPLGLVCAVVPRIIVTGKSKRVRAVRELLTRTTALRCTRRARSTRSAPVSALARSGHRRTWTAGRIGRRAMRSCGVANRGLRKAVWIWVGSDRGAVLALRPARFPDPPAAPAVRVSTQRALHAPYPLVGTAGAGAVDVHGVGMLLPR